jgi:alkylhydroperoxidase family enzyme
VGHRRGLPGGVAGAARKSLERQLSEVRNEQAEVLRRRAEASRIVDLADRWPKLTFDERRAALRAVVDRVEIAPATPGTNAFDPARMSVEWRA